MQTAVLQDNYTQNSNESVIDIQEKDKFHLDPLFIKKYEVLEPKFGPLGFVTFKRTYARPLGDLSEELYQTLQRVVEGVYTIQRWHCKRNHLPFNLRKAQRSAQEMFDRMFSFKFLPPGRGLWMMGSQYVYKHGGAALNNCGFTTTANIDQDFSEPFCFLADMSMLGVGIGADLEGAGKVVIQKPKTTLTPFVVKDSREGWVDLIRVFLDSYVGKAELPIVVDYSFIRPEGALIKGFGGVASGPGPLKIAVARIQDILDALEGKSVTSEAIVDLFNIIGVCVVSGNVRRSAEIMLGSPSDTTFANLKNPEKANGKLNAWRWASNNSIKATVGMDYSECGKATARNGEPGYLWLKNAQDFGRMSDPADFKDARAVGTNPCSEQTLEDKELCCLVETFPINHDSYADYEKTLKFAYLYAKTVTLIPTHNPKTNAVLMRNRRIGCSQSGIVQNITKIGLREHMNWSDKGYKYIDKLDSIYSDWLCVPRSIKKTSIKPSGTVSLLVGVTPGIHFEHAEYYYRTIRIASTSPLLLDLTVAGYRIEQDVADPSSRVVYFPVKAENFDRAKSEVTMFEQLELAAQMQYYWADNQVSVTISFKPEEAKDIPKALSMYETRLKSVSFLPLQDHQYEQAPYQTITKEEYELAASQISKLHITSGLHEITEKFCDGASCTI